MERNVRTQSPSSEQRRSQPSLCQDWLPMESAMEIGEYSGLEEMMETESPQPQESGELPIVSLVEPLVQEVGSTSEAPLYQISPPLQSPAPGPFVMVSENESDLDLEYVSNFNILSNEEVEADEAATLSDTDYEVDNTLSALPEVSSSFDWSEDYSRLSAMRGTFTGGLAGPTQSFDTPYDAFVAIWDEGIMQHIANETNRYAWQFISQLNEEKSLPPHSRFNEWVETDTCELYILFALYIFMGFTPLVRVDYYWYATRFFNVSGVWSLMTYNRYILLNKFLHFVDDLDYVPPNKKTLFKLTPIIDHCNSRFQQLYVLSEYVSIERPLTVWSNRLSWTRPIGTKFGNNSVALCDSSTGYLWKFVTYTEKESGQSSGGRITELARKSTAMIPKLLAGLEHKGYCLVMDNIYNSPKLARYLKMHGFHCFGTLRVNRKHVPDGIKLKQSDKAYTLVARHSGDVSVLSWKQSKVVTTISTYHGPETSLTTKAGKQVTKPIVVQDYNKYIGGIDLKNQKLSMYLIERKRGLKWYVKMFKRLLNVSIHNAYILHRKSKESQHVSAPTYIQFRRDLANAIVQSNCEEVAPEKSRTRTAELRLRRDLLHSPRYVKLSQRRRCARCSKKGVVKKVRSVCITCDKGLCFGTCWDEFHTMASLE